jgi:hypothetical protein
LVSRSAQAIALAPLNDSETAVLILGLLGSDPSVRRVVAMIAEKAAGNPFFVEDMVRDLAERGVLRGNRCAYESTADTGEVTVPVTLQATIAARIDRLDPAAKRTLSAAAVIGSRFSRELLETLGIDPALQDLLSGEFIDQITFTRQPVIIGSPLALALTSRAAARYFLGRPGWRDDQRHALAMGRKADPMSYTTVVGYVYFSGIPYGVLRPGDRAMREIDDALRIAERSGDDLAVAVARTALGMELVHHQRGSERDRGQKLLAEASEMFLHRGQQLCDLPIIEVYLARETARRGDRDDAIPLMRSAVDHLFREGRLLLWGIPATGVLVEALLDRDGENDVIEAEVAIERLAAAPADDGLIIRDIWLQRLRATLARAHGDTTAYADFRDRYRDMARTLGFEGHIAWAEEMP